MLSFLIVQRGNDWIPALVGYHDELLTAVDLTLGESWEAMYIAGAANADPAAVFFGMNPGFVEAESRRAAEGARVRPLRPRGQLFLPPPGFITGYAEVRSTLERHRAELPTVDAIRHSAVFAGMTIRTGIETAERAYACIVSLYRSHGGQFAPLEKVRSCIASLGFPKTREPMYREIQAWAPIVRAAMERGLRDRELRRYLILETRVPTLLSIAKISFTLALLGQDCVCLDARLLNRSGIIEDWKGNTPLALARYERAEDAFVAGNPNYDPADPIGRARAQWISWEVSPVRGEAKPASHSVWLNVVRRPEPAKLQAMPSATESLALEDGVLQWKERPDGHWTASANGLHYDVAPDHRGGFHAWVKVDGDWHDLKRHTSLGAAFGAARRYSGQAVHAAEEDSGLQTPGGLRWEKGIDGMPVTKGRKGRFRIERLEGQHEKPFVLKLDGHTIDSYESVEQAKKVADHFNALHEAPLAASEKVPVIYESDGPALVPAPYSKKNLVDASDPFFNLQPNRGGWIVSDHGEYKGSVKKLKSGWKIEGVHGRNDDPALIRATVLLDRHAGVGSVAKETGELAVVERDVKAVRAGRKIGQLKTAKDFYELVHPALVKESQEVFVVLPLDIHGRPLAPKPFEVARGQRDQVHVDKSDVLRPVITCNAKGFLMAHCHPSGQGKASPADVELTKSICEAAREIDVVLIDHVVIGDGEFESIREVYGKKAGFR